jgi:hypothetical protein
VTQDNVIKLSQPGTFTDPLTEAGAFHLLQHQIAVEHLEIDIGLSGRISADWHQIIGTAHLHAMAGVVEQSDIGALQLATKVLHGSPECALVEVELRAATNEREAERLQRVGH